MNKIHDIIEKIKILEKELAVEIQKKEADFFYKIHGTKVYFDAMVIREHRALMTRLHTYVLNASILTVLTAPVIWFCIVPGILLDLMATVYQFTCFPVYGIPKVRRRDYIVIDRHALEYLNAIEKLNCMYCGYFNGLIAYVQEIAARTEQYWCPIKHARRLGLIHSRYRKFVAYGDAVAYKRDIDNISKDFEDLK